LEKLSKSAKRYMADRVPGDYHTIGLEGTFPRGKEEGEEGERKENGKGNLKKSRDIPETRTREALPIRAAVEN